MYPNLYFAFKDLFGIEWPFLKFLNSFGFFVALAFIAAAVVLTKELKRKGREGLLFPEEENIVVGEPASIAELLINFVIGFVLGFKVVGMLLNAGKVDDPQLYIFSGEGSWLFGILGGLAFAGLTWYEKNKKKLSPPEKRTIRIWPHDRVGQMTGLALVFGLVGAKLFDIFENWSDFLKKPSEYLFSPSGLTFYGGLICAAVAIIIYARRHKINVLHLTDAFAPALMLAYGVGRIGCQVAGDGDWGIVNTKPNPYKWLPDWMWSYTYPHNVNEVGVPIAGCEGKFCNQLPEAVYPTPFYEVVMALILFGLLWSLRKKVKVPGLIFAIYLFVNGMERFLIEKIRVNNTVNFMGLTVTQAEIIASCLMIAGVLLGVFLMNRYKKTALKQ